MERGLSRAGSLDLASSIYPILDYNSPGQGLGQTGCEQFLGVCPGIPVAS